MQEKLSQCVTTSAQSATVRIADIGKRLREIGETVYDFSAGRAMNYSSSKYQKIELHTGRGLAAVGGTLKRPLSIDWQLGGSAGGRSTGRHLRLSMKQSFFTEALAGRMKQE